VFGWAKQAHPNNNRQKGYRKVPLNDALVLAGFLVMGYAYQKAIVPLFDEHVGVVPFFYLSKNDRGVLVSYMRVCFGSSPLCGALG
jgi:hypothetical protein